MNEYYRLFTSGLLGLLLMGTGTFAVAAPQDGTNAITVQRMNMLKGLFAVQERRPPVEKSLIRPSQRRHPVPDRIYRHDKARDALKSGRIVSLSIIRHRVQQSFPGKIVDVRLIEPRRKNRPYMYIVKLLRKDGKLLVLKINAANANIVSVKGNG